MMNNDLDLLQQFQTSNHDLLELVTGALRKAGLHNVDIKSIHVGVKRAPDCPPGTEPVFEAKPQPDGSVVFQLICK